jgi:mloB
MSELRTNILISDLLKMPSETPWIEFKESNNNAELIGKLISALSNAACMNDKPCAYVLWGIEDKSHKPVGTQFHPFSQKQNKQPLELWLAQHLNPAPAIRFQEITYQGKNLVLLEIPAANSTPVEFDRTAYIRIGEATPKLSDHPQHLRTLWAKLQSFAWESGIAASFLDGDTVLDRLDYTAYFGMTGQRLPDNRTDIFNKLDADGLIRKDVGEYWNITHLGAILFAKRLSDFPSAIARKAVRFVAYKGISRADTVMHRLDEERDNQGYAIGFASLLDYINKLIPRNEHIGAAFREEQPLYPVIAIRELVANALIHQDMTITGTGPLIELFADRLEITNPGQPLVAPSRFLDLPPRSRNEALAALMRRMKICEEQGTGIDKVLTAVEMHQLPAPDFRAENQVENPAVRVTLFAPRRFADMTPQERIRACYQHAALCYVAGKKMTNASLRERLGIEQQNSSQASNVIKMTLKEKLICFADPQHPKIGYYPIWAQPDEI